MKRSYPFFLLAAVLLSFPTGQPQAQITPFGLQGRTVYSLATYGVSLYAGTDTGVYRMHLFTSDSTWSLVGLAGTQVNAVYPHQFGPIGFAVTAGVTRGPGDPDSTLIFCSCGTDTLWVAADSGIDHSEYRSIATIDGFMSEVICGETYAGGNSTVFRKLTEGWDSVLSPGAVRVIRTNAGSATVWAGGQTGFLAPYIARAHNKGTDWVTSYPNVGGDNECLSLAFDGRDTNIVFAGLWGKVIRTTDGGQTWDSTGLNGVTDAIRALAFDNFCGVLFAGGWKPSGSDVYVSADSGRNWVMLNPSTLPGILSMTIAPTLIPEFNMLLLGTDGGGVVRINYPITNVPVEKQPLRFALEQNFPNPFNPSTVIRYQLSVASDVTLRVYDILGRTVTTLVNDHEMSGLHSVTWSGVNDQGASVSTGVYFYRLTAGGLSQTRRILLVR